jgi:hypothetical protein
MVGAALRGRVDPAAWRRRPPPVGSRQPLTVEFDRPLDHALLRRCLWVSDAAGARLEGGVTVGPGERSWHFQPNAPWDAAAKLLVVDTSLEDVAGNSVSRVFDRDLDDPADEPLQSRRLALPL